MRSLLSPRARADPEEIGDYVAQDSDSAALQVLDRILTEIRRLTENPAIGHVREDLAPNLELRFWPVYSYLIIYRFDAETLEVVRILSGFRDLNRMLD